MRLAKVCWLSLASLVTACGQMTARDIPFNQTTSSFLDVSARLTDFASVEGYAEIYRNDQAQIVSFRRELPKPTQFSVKAAGNPVSRLTVWGCRSSFDQASASRIVERTLSEMTSGARQVTFMEESNSSCSNTELK